MISDGNRLFRVTGAKKIIWGLFLKNLRFCVKKTKIYNKMEARFKVSLTMQIILPKFEGKHRCSQARRKFFPKGGGADC